MRGRTGLVLLSVSLSSRPLNHSSPGELPSSWLPSTWIQNQIAEAIKLQAELQPTSKQAVKRTKYLKTLINTICSKRHGK